MYKCCQSDVDILRRGCMKLRELFIQIANIDPFQYITIASVCHATYRSRFLPVNTIAIADEAQVDTHSVKSIKWLQYIAQKENIRIRHACNEGEQCITVNRKTYKVDGYCEDTKTIYQFHGCYYHSHVRHHRLGSSRRQWVELNQKAYVSRVSHQRLPFITWLYLP